MAPHKQLEKLSIHILNNDKNSIADN